MRPSLLVLINKMDDEAGQTKATWHRIVRDSREHLAFDSLQQREQLRALRIHAHGLGVASDDKKNLTLCRPPFLLGQLASLYVSQK